MALSEIGKCLRFPAGSGWLSLPAWARFFIDIGFTVAKSARGASPRVVAIVTPARAYAAVLCATGVVSAKVSAAGSLSRQEHFDHLRSLPPGTTVNFRETPNSQVKGWLQGALDIGEQSFIVIRLQVKSKGGLTYRIPTEQSHRIEVAVKPLASLPARPHPKTFRANAPLLEFLLRNDDRDEFLRRVELQCAIVGKYAQLREEILETRFAAQCESLAVGRLQDLLRIRRFLENDGGGYLSQVYSYGTLDETPDDLPHVAIFDGSTSFLKGHGKWPNAHRVVILDRTDRQLPDAAAELNRAYASRATDVDTFCPTEPPEELEFLIF